MPPTNTLETQKGFTMSKVFHAELTEEQAARYARIGYIITCIYKKSGAKNYERKEWQVVCNDLTEHGNFRAVDTSTGAYKTPKFSRMLNVTVS